MGLVKELLHFHREFHMGQKLMLEHRHLHGAAPGISSAELLGVTRCHGPSPPLGTAEWEIHGGSVPDWGSQLVGA